MTDAEKLTRAIQGLRDICNPIGMIEREMPPGAHLNGAECVRLLDDPMTFRDIARVALQDMDEWEATP